MAVVIEFKRPAPARRSAVGKGNGAGAEIIVFTGVRYQRAGAEAVGVVKVRRPGRTPRPKGSGRQCDSTSRPGRSS